MEMKIVTANKITQTTGGQFQTWNNLNNIRNTNPNSTSQTGLIRGKSTTPNRPSTLTLTDFRCNLPTGSRVKKIVVRASYNKLYETGYVKTCEPGKPKITLIGFGGVSSQLGATTSTPIELIKRNFYVDIDASLVNAEKFGFVLNFPTNLNNVRGYVIIRNLYLEIYYEVPNYEITINKVTGEYKDDEYTITSTISNKTNTQYIPGVTLTIPSGFYITSHETKGNINQDGNTLQWTPQLNGVSSDTLTLKLRTSINFGDTNTYTGTFTITENYRPQTKTLNVTVQRYQPTSIETLEDTSRAIQNEEYTYTWKFTSEEMERIRSESTEGYVEFNYSDLNGEIQSVQVAEADWLPTNEYTITTTPLTIGFITMKLGYATDTTLTYYFKEVTIEVIPSDTDAREVGYTILQLTEEELNRLGNGQVYTAQTWLCPNETSTNVRDWKYNYRLGVFNDTIPANITNYTYTNQNGETEEITVDNTDYENLTLSQIIDHTIWSDAPTIPNNYNNLECTFRYNKDYPLYIIVTGDCTIAPTICNPRFTEPVISETAYYKGAEPNGLFPIPILNNLSNENTSELLLPALNTGNTMVFSDFNLTNEFENKVIRGVMVTGDMKGENTAIASKLINQGNETRTKSLVLEETDTSFSLGQYGDLWGFKTNDIENFNDWEIHLTPSNTVNDASYVYLNNIRFTLFLEEVDNTNVTCYVDGEDLSYYGVFLTELKIPEGLKTDVNYLKVNGTDINDPYQQAIRKKEIEIQFDLSDICDVNGNTFALRQLTKLLTTKRDKYNRPIPKRIEFSHYPDVYWEYILEDGFTPELNINTYTVKVKLTVPKGTAYTKKSIVTTGQGYVDGLTYINPIILIKPYDKLISITEKDSKQTFNIGYTNYTGKSMRIDCPNRKVYLIDDNDNTNVQDISKYVDVASDWFKLTGYFDFEATGALIQTVTYQERW